LYDEWAGRMPGDSQVRLWGSERDFISGKKDWMNKIYRWCRNELFLNSFKMTDDMILDYIKEINQKKPKMILAYVQSIREVARYIERNHIKVYSPKGIMTSAGNLDPATYELLCRVFRCPILNRYGSREMGDMACSCAKNEGLHMNMGMTYIEILNQNGQNCMDGEVGDIITTSLIDYSMPIIRYKIGDRGALSAKQCSCGRGLKMLEGIKGRTVDVFKSSDGGMVDGEYFTHLFYNEKEIKQFQIIQDRMDHIIVKLVAYDKNRLSEEFYRTFETNSKKVLGDSIIFEYQFMEDIPPENSGKRAYTICRI
jgi:phenylacetate-CoA ligase